MPVPSNTLLVHQQELVTDEVQEVISYRPHWIVRRGNLILFCLVACLLSLSWFIRYPDKIAVSGRLMAINPPKLIPARTSGKLMKLFVNNEQPVVRGQHLGYMESTASYDEIIQLTNWVNQSIGFIQEGRPASINSLPLPLLTNLGDIQTSYQQLQTQLAITSQTFDDGYFAKKRSAIEQDIAFLSKLKYNAEAKKQLQEDSRLLQQKELQAYEQLAHEKVIAPLELNELKGRMLNQSQQLENLTAEVTNSELRKHSKLKEILDLQKQVNDLQQEFRSSLLQLKADLDKWMQRYTLIAPENGTALYASSIAENQLINIDEPLFYIQPVHSTYYVELMADQKGFGKIEKGQRVLLQVEAYPADQFGYLTGRIDYLASIPNRKDSFLLKAVLPNGLVTNYNKALSFHNHLSASAAIITGESRLIERLIGQWRRHIR